LLYSRVWITVSKEVNQKMQELKRKKYFIKLELELELNENDTGLCSVAHISIE